MFPWLIRQMFTEERMMMGERLRRIKRILLFISDL